MLHNSGPYGPNEAPINMGATVNITPMSTPMNLGQNLDNLGKNLQQPAQTESPHYILPDFSSYRPSSSNMNPPMSPFHGYQTGTIQSDYLVQNPAIAHNSSWQNSMYPTTMNTHTNIVSNMLNYSVNDEKQSPNSLGNQELESQMMYPKTMPINIPQVPTKPLHNINNDSYSMYNVNKDRFNNYSNIVDGKCEEKPLIDSNKRKSLENTVRLIEDILENTAKNKELEKHARDAVKIKKNENKNIKSKDDSTQNQEHTLSYYHNSINLMKQPFKSDQDTLIQPEDLNREVNINHHNDEKPNNSNTIENNDEPKLNETMNRIKDTENTQSYDNVQIKDTENTQSYDNVQIKVEIEEEPIVTVKVEQMDWMDLEFGNPFHRDANGITREDLGDRVFIDGESSVDVAKADIKNDITSNSYYECPHCNLCFEQPKRFLIHHKWHSFGALHNKVADIFKKKEFKRTRKVPAKEEEMSLTNEGEPQKFPCQDCGKDFFTKASLMSHSRRIHSTRVRECKVCGKEIAGYKAMKKHRTIHNRDKEPAFQCPDCDKMFRHKHTLAKHRDTHLEKTVACEQCPKKYGSLKQLKMHMKTHERVERGPTHSCSYCPRAFYETFHLQVHERMHRNERPFGCDICSTHFATNSSLKRHMKVSHSTQKPFECSHCHRCFVSAAIRDGHEARLHGDPKQFKFLCELCDGRYYKLKDLQKHMYKVHPKRKKTKKEAETTAISDSE